MKKFLIEKVYDIDDLDHMGDLMEVRLFDITNGQQPASLKA